MPLAGTPNRSDDRAHPAENVPTGTPIYVETDTAQSAANRPVQQAATADRNRCYEQLKMRFNKDECQSQ